MNLLNEINRINFDGMKPRMVGVGQLIRKVIYTLNKSLNDSIVELSNQTNTENKKKKLVEKIENINRGINKLSKFIKNVQKFKKLYKVDLLSTITYFYQDILNEINNQLYQNMSYCKLIRIPKFNLNETAGILNNNSHEILRTEIVNLATRYNLFENKEKIFNFHEKYYYMEGSSNQDDLKTKINYSLIRNKMKEYVKKCYSFLNFDNVIFRVNNNSNHSDFEDPANMHTHRTSEYFEFLENESYFYLIIGKFLKFKILFFFLMQEDNKPMLTYYVQKIDILGNQKLKEKFINIFNQKLFEINNIIRELIAIDLNEAELATESQHGYDFKLNDIKKILKNYSSKNFSKIIFQNSFIIFKEVIEKNIYLAHKTEFEKTKKEFKFTFEMNPKIFDINFSFSLYLDEQIKLIKQRIGPKEANDLPLHQNPIESKDSKETYSENIFRNDEEQKMKIEDLNLNENRTVTNEGEEGAKSLQGATNPAQPEACGKINPETTISAAALNYLNTKTTSENFIVLNFSHKILKKNPLILINNQKIKYNLFEINTIDFKKILLDKINEYQEIIYEKLCLFFERLKLNFIFFNVKKFPNNSKLNVYFDRYLLFSVCISNKFEIIIQETQTFFSDSISKSYLESSILAFLQEDTQKKFSFRNPNFLDFNKFIFSKFIQNYYKTNEIHASIDFNFTATEFALKMCLIDQKLNESKCYLVIELEKSSTRSELNLSNLSLFDNKQITKNLLKLNHYVIKDIYMLIEPKELMNLNIYDEKSIKNTQYVNSSPHEPNMNKNNNLNSNIASGLNTCEPASNTYGVSNNGLKSNNNTSGNKKEIFSLMLNKRHKIYINQYLIDSNRLKENLIFDFYQKRFSINIDYDFFTKLTDLFLTIKAKNYEIFQSLSDFIFYFEKFKISDDFDSVNINIEDNLESIKRLFKTEEEVKYFRRLFSEIEFNNKICGLELKFKPEFEEFFSHIEMKDKMNQYVESEYCQSYEPETKNIIFKFITKQMQKSSETNIMKKIFDKFIPKFLLFMKRIRSFLENEEFKKILKASDNVSISPIGIKFTYNFFNDTKRTVMLTFIHKKNDNNYLRIFISHLPKNVVISYSMELLAYYQKILNESNLNIVDFINNLVFFFIIIEKTFNKFPFYLHPIGKEIYNYIANPSTDNNTPNESFYESNTNSLNNFIPKSQNFANNIINNNNNFQPLVESHERNKVYAFVKDFKKIYLICLNKFSLIVEIQDSKTLLLHSPTFDTNSQSKALINSFVDLNKIGNGISLQYINHGNCNNHIYNEISSDIKNKSKIIFINNDSIEILKFIDIIFDRVQNF